MVVGLGDSDRMPDLADLIQARLDAGVSLHDLDRLSGGRVPYQTFSRWHRRKMTQFPRDGEVFEDYAAALDVNVDQVLLSMAVQLGVPIRRTFSAASFLPPGTERLTDRQRDALRQLIRTIIEAQPAGLVTQRDQVALAASDEAEGDGQPRRPKRSPRRPDTGPTSS